MSRTVAIYCRISNDPTGREAGVKRQERDCRALADRLGWTIERVYVDDDVSAYTGVERPAYTRMLAAVERGAVDAIIAWHPDRLYRRLPDLLHLIPLVERHKLAIATVTAGDIDLSTPTGRANAKTAAVWAEHESEHKADRIRAASTERAEQGKPHGKTMYGWTRVQDYDAQGRRVGCHDEINPETAAVVVDAAKRVLAGEAVRAIVRDLNDRGVGTHTGKPWQPSILRAVLLRPANAGLRVHHAGKPDETRYPSASPPILDDDTWDRVCAVLKDHDRRSITTNARTHLLSGLATCGKCGRLMRAKTVKGTPLYTCSVGYCVARRRDWVDAYIAGGVIDGEPVRGVVVERLSRPDALDLLASDSREQVRAARDEAEAIRVRMADAADSYADGDVTAAQLARINARLRPKLADAEARATPSGNTDVLAGLAGAPDVADRWQRLSLTRKRAVIACLMTVTILPRGKGARHRFDPAAVRITWRSS